MIWKRRSTNYSFFILKQYCYARSEREYCICTSRYRLEILSPCFPKRLREGHKNFDVYPRDKKKPILSARRNKAPPFSRPLSICVRTGARFCFTAEAGKEQRSGSFSDESSTRGILKDRGWSAYASLSETHAKLETSCRSEPRCRP